MPENQGPQEQRPWHRVFALAWMDFFRGLPVTVELERDLSVKKQLLDLLFEFLQTHQQEGQIMADMLEELHRETISRLLKELPIEKRVEGLTQEDIDRFLQALPPERRLAGLTMEDIDRLLKGLPTARRLEGLTADQIAQVLSPETLQELAKKIKVNGGPAKPE
jgi:hypothetical protein